MTHAQMRAADKFLDRVFGAARMARIERAFWDRFWRSIDEGMRRRAVDLLGLSADVDDAALVAAARSALLTELEPIVADLRRRFPSGDFPRELVWLDARHHASAELAERVSALTAYLGQMRAMPEIDEPERPRLEEDRVEKAAETEPEIPEPIEQRIQPQPGGRTIDPVVPYPKGRADRFLGPWPEKF